MPKALLATCASINNRSARRCSCTEYTDGWEATVEIDFAEHSHYMGLLGRVVDFTFITARRERRTAQAYLAVISHSADGSHVHLRGYTPLCPT